VAPGRVILVGDSVMAALEPNYTDAARKVLGAAGWNVAIDAEVNRSTIQGRQVLKALRPGPADTVVLMLGHNDAGTPSVFAPRVDGILDDLDGVGRVFWLTMREPRYAPANAVLSAERAAHPNLRIIPWAASIQPGWTAKDGLHLNGSGATGMANLILQAITTR
jgi:lysophospholipase L1-like esterase